MSDGYSRTYPKKESSLIGREPQRDRIMDMISKTRNGQGSMMLIEGEGGIGKTFLLEQISQEAKAIGFNILWGRCLDYRRSPNLPFKDMLCDHFGIIHNDTYESKKKKVLSKLKGPVLLDKEFYRTFIDLFIPTDDPVGGFKLEGRYLDKLISHLQRSGYRIVILRDENEDPVRISGVEVVNVGEGEGSVPPNRLEKLASLTKGAYHRYRHCAVVNDCNSTLMDKNPRSKLENFIKITNGMAVENGSLCIQIDRGGMDELISGIISLRSWLLEKSEKSNEEEQSSKVSTNEIFSKFVKETSRDRPLLIVLEDLQWGDKSSLNLLQYLARDAASHRYSILGSYRPEEYGLEGNDMDKTHLKDALQRISREKLYETITLERLDADDQKKVIIEHASSDIDEQEIKKIIEKAEGIPRFIREYLQDIENDREGSGPSNGQSEGQEDKDISRRIAGLPREAREMLEFASVFGKHSRLDIVIKGLGLNVERSLDILDSLADLKLVTEIEDVLSFDHPRTRDMIYSSIPKKIRKELHLKAAGSIEMSHSYKDRDMKLRDLSYHYHRGGNLMEAQRIYFDLAEIERERMNEEEALADLDKVLECLDGMTPTMETDIQKVKTLQMVGDIKEGEGDTKGAIIAFKEAVELAERRSIPFGLSSSYRRIGDMMLKLFEWEQTIDYYLRSLHLSKKENDQQEVAKAFRGLGVIYYLKGDYNRSMECYLKYMDFPKKDMGSHYVMALTEVGDIYYERGNFNQAMTYYKMAIKKGEEKELKNETALAYIKLSDVLIKSGDVDDAKRFGSWAYNMVKNHLVNEISQRVLLGYIELMLESSDMEKVDDAMRVLSTIPLRELGDRLLTARRFRTIGLVMDRKRDFENSNNNMEQALDIHKVVQVPYQLALSYYQYGLVLFHQMRVDDAMTMLKNASKIFRSISAIYYLNRTSAKVREIQFIREGMKN
jgi:tetratricopeptide (TPR) repeat protein